MSQCSRHMPERSTRRNPQPSHSCGSCCEDPVAKETDDNGEDKIVLRSGRKIVSAPSSQEEKKVEDGDTQDMFQGLTFIQCEKESCLKWRKITQEEAELYKDESWFCCMNKNDPDHCRCDQPEEDQFVQLAESSGFQYTFSVLPAGTLVWAKMTGHVPWPSIITQDKDTKLSFYKEGTGECYHVEFLGRRHYHQWLSPLHIDPYGDGRKPEFPPDLPSKKKTKKKGIQFTRSESLLRNKQYQRNFELATAEAEDMKTMSIEKRLQKCVYQYREPKVKKPKPEPKKEIKREPKKQVKVETPKPVQDTKPVPEVQENTPSVRPTRERKRFIPFVQEVPGKPPEVPSAKSKKKSPSQEKPKPPPVLKKQSKCQKKLFKSKKGHQNLSQVLLQEERLFNGAWDYFMRSQGLVFDRKLSFDGSSLSAFRLFMSVQERGGYKEMTSSDWEAVSCELSKKPSADKCQSSLLKKLYKRNLLPYQKHLLPNKQEDPNNNRVATPSSSSSSSLKKEPSQSIPNTAANPQFGYPAANVPRLPTPFVTTAGNSAAQTYSAPTYPASYSSSGPTVTHMNNNFSPSTSSVVSNPATPQNFYSGSGGASSNSGSYGLTWKPAVGGTCTDANKVHGVTTNARSNVQAMANSNRSNYQPMNNCMPLSSGANYYGSSGGAVSSSAGTYNNRPRPVGAEMRGNVGMPTSNGSGWQQKPSVQFNKDIIDIDNIIQALDRANQLEQPAVGQNQFVKPLDTRRPEFYSMPYENQKHQMRTPQPNYMDDAQCVPETVMVSNYNGRVSTPPTYAYPGAQLGDLVQETARLDEALHMELSEL